jgi:hypothetical protein
MSGTGVKIISPTSPLPTITDTVTIDGYTLLGSRRNGSDTNSNNALLLVEIRGSSAPQTADGLVVSGAGAANTTIEGLAIKRFGDDGLSINAPAAKVVGNFIGTNAAGNDDLGNGGNGVRLLSSQNVVGRSENATQNVISGNVRHGVEVSNIGAEGARIVGNLIGLDRNGNGFSDVGNSRDGVRVSSTPRVEIGDTVEGGVNAISDNGEHGVESVGTSSTTNVVLGNRIGTNFNGSSDFGNAGDGVRIGNSSNALIGGTQEGARNVISDNGDEGVWIIGTSANDNLIQGNFIGTDANGINNLGNDIGVSITGASGNSIGGTVDAAANKIALNSSQGVIIAGDAATGNSILRNSIFGNGIPPGLSIDLGDNDVTANDTKDPDTGPNGLQNFPVLTSASETRIEGRLNSRPGRTFTIQFFSNPPQTTPLLIREGTTFLGERTVETNGEGRVSFAFNTSVNTGEVVTATATIHQVNPSRLGNTSEFSAARVVS